MIETVIPEEEQVKTDTKAEQGFIVPEGSKNAKLVNSSQNGLELQFEVPLTKEFSKEVKIYGPGSRITSDEWHRIARASDRICVVEYEGRGWMGFGVSNHGELLQLLEEVGIHADGEMRMHVILNDKSLIKNLTTQYYDYDFIAEQMAQDILDIVPADCRVKKCCLSGAGSKEIGSDIIQHTKFKFELDKITVFIKRRPVKLDEPDGQWVVWRQIPNFPEHLKRDFSAER